jgi:hypothetical protein
LHNRLDYLIEIEQLNDLSAVLYNLLNGIAILTCFSFIGTVVGVYLNLDTSLILPTVVFCGVTTIGCYISHGYCNRKISDHDGV